MLPIILIWQNHINTTIYNILDNKIRPLLPQVSRQKCGIITTLVSGFIGLAYEGISSFPPTKSVKMHYRKDVHAMSN